MALPEIDYQKMVEEILHEVDYDIFKDYESGERDFDDIKDIIKNNLSEYVDAAEDVQWRMDGLSK